MAEIIAKNAGPGGIQKKPNPRIDLTPMVDLGFLLITFFIFTASLNEPKCMDINMPMDGDPTTLAHHTAMTLFLSKEHKIYYYSGEDAMNNTYENLKETNFKTIRSALFLHAKNVKDAYTGGLKGSKRNDVPFIIIKASRQSQYIDLVNMLDELMITEIPDYAIMDINEEEETEISKRGI